MNYYINDDDFDLNSGYPTYILPFDYDSTFFDFTMGCAYGQKLSAESYANTIEDAGFLDRLKSDIKDLCATHHHVFEETCTNGHLEMVQWLVKFSGMSIIEFHTTEFANIFKLTCLMRQMHVCEWICDQLISIWDIEKNIPGIVDIFDTAQNTLTW
jgi:hypothetical protein